MAEYIEREALKKQMNATCRNCDARFDERECGRCGMEWARKIIREAPAADVVEVKHGTWLPQVVLGTKAWDCSECKTLGSPMWKWCPICGAKMDGERRVER